MRKDEAIVKAGVGFEKVRLGQTENEVRMVLGKPDRVIRRFEDSYFLIYSDLGMDLDFGERGGRLKIIFFYRNGVQGHREARMRTDRGVRLGDTHSKVLSIYGDPNSRSSLTGLPSGKHPSEWIYYNEGIQFDLGVDNRVEVISVSLPV
jgi:hypothetical protein